jgi:hypothetical protein
VKWVGDLDYSKIAFEYIAIHYIAIYIITTYEFLGIFMLNLSVIDIQLFKACSVYISVDSLLASVKHFQVISIINLDTFVWTLGTNKG